MVQATLALNAVLGMATALLYLFVGRVFSRRPTTSDEASKAKRSFVLWWVALSVSAGIGSLQQFLGSVGILDVGIHATLSFFVLPPIMLALAGLLQYLVYIHTGSLRWHVPILVAHVALAFVFFALIAWLRPVGVTASVWSVEVQHARDPPGWFRGLALATIILPVVVASAAYFTLAFRRIDRLARFRILTVSGAFLLWFGSAGLASIFGWNEWYWWPLVARAIGLVATLMVLFAYMPGRRIEQRLRDDEMDGPGYGSGGPRTLRLAFARRARRSIQRATG